MPYIGSRVKRKEDVRLLRGIGSNASRSTVMAGSAATGAALANAVSNALGVEVAKLPLKIVCY